MQQRIEGVEILPLVQHRDQRGWLAEILKAPSVEGAPFGQILVTVALPGVAKGGHYHHHKVEWFCVIQGRARLVLQELSSGRRQEIDMGESNMLTVKIPPHIGHSIQNTGSETMVLLVYANEVFDPNDPDTFAWSDQ